MSQQPPPGKGQGIIDMGQGMTRPVKLRGKIRLFTPVGGVQETILEIALDKKAAFMEKLDAARKSKGWLLVPTPEAADTWISFEYVMTYIIGFDQIRVE